MRDGVNLVADVYRPEAPGSYPTLLQRTPYSKDALVYGPFVLRSAAAGYAVMLQDVRGRYKSGGDFYPMVNEKDDGFDTLEWISQQPWSDGNVGMFGGSYNGLTQWQAAMSGHKALKTIIPTITASNYHDGWTYQGGAFELAFNLSWTLTALMADSVLRDVGDNGKASDEYRELVDLIDGLFDEYERLPLSGHDLISRYAPYYDDWLAHPTFDEYWKDLDISRVYDQLDIPALNMGGWYDIFQKGTIENFTGMHSRDSANGIPQRQSLVIGPWNHPGMREGNPIGDVNFGIGSSGAGIDADGIQLRWFDRWLRGIDNGVEHDPPVRIFVMGSNEWRDEHEWPLARTDWQEWYLHSQGAANSLNGDGLLNRERPGTEPPDSFTYNPLRPVPSKGGGLCCNPVFSHGGAFDQREVEMRDDVLVYSTPPLEEPVEITGPITLILYASTTALDTDFTGKLVDVAPCGYARNLTDGILRARYRNSMEHEELLTPQEVVRYEIDLWSTSNRFLKGHQIRLEVSSSNFPRFDRNPNTGELPATATDMAPALQSIFHTADYPSALVLPVIPDDA